MKRIVECVPNFSEGRSSDVVNRIISVITAVSNVKLLDFEMDATHNRAVVTFIGEPDGVKKAAFAAIKKAAEEIDMEQHEGGHPRIGATDVVPFIPIKNVSVEECVKLAEELGREVADELDIPVYLYEDAARSDERRNLANIRKGQYEGLKELIRTDPSRKPDFGPSKMHPRAGAVVIGSRMPLIAYNVNLNTNDLELAKSIAKTIRFKDGGFPFVKAMGLKIEEKNCVQISMNLTNYLKTPVHVVYDRVAELAAGSGVEVLESEIIGLIPNDALLDAAQHYLKARDFSYKQVLEKRIE